ncbi:hypothetical protein QA639_17375 [Bradyrhizobium pachyrhizi]|uniref:hypothetical protein n=1 Tax=Bradyrhizobium pachyrhizi TaxID=280333 RepID=UPI0024B21716|nr:hypothetical protein [Bradyrhizobium pachyrhizi]WFU59173.1 hypothetical protein QA639_17375 [Bradyrhizobium pachyrhizi]
MAASFSALANAPLARRAASLFNDNRVVCVAGQPRFDLCYQQAHDSHGTRVGENFRFFAA